MLPQSAQVRIFGEPFEIAIPEFERFFQRCCRKVEITVQRIAARKIIKNQRVVRLKPRQALIDFEAVIVFATLRVMVAKYLQRFNESRVPADDPLHKTNLNIQLAHVFARQFPGPDSGLLRHIPRYILSIVNLQVNLEMPLKGLNWRAEIRIMRKT